MAVKRIVYVDSNQGGRENTKHVLEKKGYIVIPIPDLVEADKLFVNNPDMFDGWIIQEAITDGRRQQQDGNEFAKKLLEAGTSAKIIVVCSNTVDRDNRLHYVDIQKWEDDSIGSIVGKVLGSQ